MEISEQVLTLDLPTLLVDPRTARVAMVTQPGVRSMGQWAVEGTASVGLNLGSEADDPSHLSVSFRLLAAHYSPPADCSREVLELVNRVNLHLSANLLGESSPTASA
jgi:hypothetical protein